VSPCLQPPAGTTIIKGPLQGSQVLQLWQSGKVDGMRLIASTQVCAPVRACMRVCVSVCACVLFPVCLCSAVIPQK